MKTGVAGTKQNLSTGKSISNVNDFLDLPQGFFREYLRPKNVLSGGKILCSFTLAKGRWLRFPLDTVIQLPLLS